MSQSLAQIYIHLIFSTKERRPVPFQQVRDDLMAFMGGILRDQDSHAVCMNVMPDHAHILYRQSKDVALSHLVKHVKGGSSRWLNDKGGPFRGFRWQAGYAAFSVSASRVQAVQRYIHRQEVHHRKTTFQDEVRRFFREYGVDYDERYVWD